MNMKDLSVEPPKAALSNVETGEVMRFQFNPPELVEEVSANYARLSPLGLSHQILHYINTNNHRLPIEIYVSDIAANVKRAADAAASGGGGVVSGWGGGGIVSGAALPTGLSAPGRSSTLQARDPDRMNADDAKRFLLSLIYPVKSESGTFGPPPRVIFVWPSVVRMRCVVSEGPRFTHRRFSLRTAATTALMAELTLEESRATPLWSQHVRQFGSRRTP